MKRAPRSRQRHDLYAKYHDYDSEISDLLGECGSNQDWAQINALIKNLNDVFGSDAEKYQESPDGLGSVSLEFTREKHERQRSTARELFTVKNGAFREEREWRLFVYDSMSNISDVEFRESRGTLSPYVRLKVPVDAIVGVTLGPTNKTSEAMVKAALEAYEVDAWVKRSNASYRRA
ncbi:MAG: hypothetical protein ACLGIE_03095 [Alphaproteobacteria bacterium]